MSWSSRKEDRRDICTLVKENQGNNLVTPRNFLFILLLYMCQWANHFFLTEIFFHLVWCQGCRGETAAGAYLPGCVGNIIYFMRLYCATLILSLHFYVFFSLLVSVLVPLRGLDLGEGDCSDRRIRMSPDPDDWCLLYIISCRHFLVSRSAK